MTERKRYKPIDIKTWSQALNRLDQNRLRTNLGIGPLGQEGAKTWSLLRRLLPKPTVMIMNGETSKNLRLD